MQIKALHQYDCQRANKSTFAWGLEARVPFLDKAFINVAMNIDPENKMVAIKNVTMLFRYLYKNVTELVYLKLSDKTR